MKKKKKRKKEKGSFERKNGVEPARYREQERA